MVTWSTDLVPVQMYFVHAFVHLQYALLSGNDRLRKWEPQNIVVF